MSTHRVDRRAGSTFTQWRLPGAVAVASWGTWAALLVYAAHRAR